jgi:Superinfection immunity protein
VAVVICVIGFIGYWVPTIAASSNHHRNRIAIGMLNLFLGWTVIGWLVALVWADNDNCECDRASRFAPLDRFDGPLLSEQSHSA